MWNLLEKLFQTDKQEMFFYIVLHQDFLFFAHSLKNCLKWNYIYCWSCDVDGVEWVWWTDDLLEKLIKTMESSHNIAANYQHNTHNTTDKCKLFPINLQQQLLIELLYLDYWKPRIQNVGLDQKKRKTEKVCYFKDALFIDSYKFSWWTKLNCVYFR